MKNNYNKYLQQQLRESFGDLAAIPENCQALFHSISGTYDQFENDHEMVARAIDARSKEMTDLQENLLFEKAELSKSHKKLTNLFEDINEVLYSVDMIAYKFKHITSVCEKIYGYPASAFLADTNLWQQLIHPEDRHIGEDQIQKLNRGEQVINQYRIIHKDGSTRWTENKIMPSIDETGKLIFIDGVTSDISKRKVSIQRVADSERRYRRLFEQNLAGVYRTTTQGLLLTCNDAFATMLGYDSAQELLNINVSRLYFSLHDRDKFIARLKADKKLYNYEAVLKRCDGSPAFVIENVTLYIDPETGEEIYDGVMIDVTQKKKAEQVLELSNTRLEEAEILGNSGYWHWDSVDNLVSWSAGNYRVFGISPDEFDGTNDNFLKRVYPEDVKHVKMLLRRLFHTREIQNLEFRIIRPDGTVRNLVGTGKANVNQSGKLVSMFGTTLDITDAKLAEEMIHQSESRLERKNAELHLKNKELEQFTYVASHDLQEPLRTMSSFMELLRDQYQGKQDENTEKYFSFIFNAADRMKVLIKDLLDYSRIGKKNEAMAVDCSMLIQEVLADLNLAITEAGAEVVTHSLPVVKAFPTEIKQLFQNLITNAIKFRKKNTKPRVEISAEKTGPGWTFTVMDDGIGIEEQHREQVFIIFQRLHTRAEYEGSGIGLAHCKKIVEMHGGNIWIESKSGEGSKFHFSLPQNNTL